MKQQWYESYLWFTCYYRNESTSQWAHYLKELLAEQCCRKIHPRLREASSSVVLCFLIQLCAQILQNGRLSALPLPAATFFWPGVDIKINVPEMVFRPVYLGSKTSFGYWLLHKSAASSCSEAGDEQLPGDVTCSGVQLWCGHQILGVWNRDTFLPWKPPFIR